LGARLEYLTTFRDGPAKPYLELNFWHGFGGTDVTIYNSTIPIPVPFGNTDVQIVAGATSQTWDSTALTIRIGYTGSIDGNYQQAIEGQLGLRYNW
jgi:outer membrane autotransporter protein